VGKPYKQDLDKVYHYFPALTKRRKTLRRYCSGGEMQMLVIGRALMATRSFCCSNEPSLGCASHRPRRSSRSLSGSTGRRHHDRPREQNANMALQIATYGYVMENGRSVMEGRAEELRENPDVKEFYLGMGLCGTVKSYKV